MDQRRPEHGEYIYQVRENTRHYIESLRAQVEKLTGQLASLETERSILDSKLQSADSEISLHKRENYRLIHRFDALEVERERTAEYHATIEHQNNDLANLYVAAYGLHGTLDHAAVVCAIQEIVTNLVGSEEMAIFELDRAREVLSLVSSMGIDKYECSEIPLGVGLIGQATASGAQYIAGDEIDADALPYESRLTACIPLRIDDKVQGAVAIFGLLQQKPALESLDFEIFDLLAGQAAIALHSARLQARSEASENTA